MHIGLQIPSFKYPGGTETIRPKLKDIVSTADEVGFHSIWVMDHYYQIKGLFGEAYNDPMLEAYTTLGYLAGLTNKVILGTLVTGVIYRHPAVLLKMLNTLDILSGGRAYLGIGAAWYEEEAHGFGLPYPDTSERFEWLEETLQMAHQLWGADETTFQGNHFQTPQLTNNPRPISQPRPRVMIGGMGPKKTMRLVAQYADACNLFEGAGEERMTSTLDALRQHCDTLDRDYASIEKTSLGTAYLASGHDSVSEIMQRLETLARLGFTQAIFNMPNVYEITPLEVFGKEIIPAAAEM